MSKVYIYKGFERFWHWTQASLIMFLAVTGFEVHGTFEIFGFEKAAEFHRTASWLLIGLIIISIFWHFTTGEWRQYIPTTKKLKEQIMFYLVGIFKGEHHPTAKTQLRKLNPLQRIVYLAFKLVLIPMTLISGIMYMLYKSFDLNNKVVVEDFSLESIAFWHTLGAILLIVFLIIHVYMTTTGETPTSNINAMITGYEDLDDEDEIHEHNEEVNKETNLNKKVNQ